MVVVSGPRSLPPTEQSVFTHELTSPPPPAAALFFIMAGLTLMLTLFCKLFYVYLMIDMQTGQHASLCVVKFKGVSVTLRTLLRSVFFVDYVWLYFD